MQPFIQTSQDAKITEWQRITHEFWQDARFEFIVLDIVIDEISAGDKEQAASARGVHCRDAGYSPPRVDSPKAIMEEL